MIVEVLGVKKKFHIKRELDRAAVVERVLDRFELAPDTVVGRIEYRDPATRARVPLESDASFRDLVAAWRRNAWPDLRLFVDIALAGSGAPVSKGRSSRREARKSLTEALSPAPPSRSASPVNAISSSAAPLPRARSASSASDSPTINAVGRVGSSRGRAPNVAAIFSDAASEDVARTPDSPAANRNQLMAHRHGSRARTIVSPDDEDEAERVSREELLAALKQPRVEVAPLPLALVESYESSTSSTGPSPPGSGGSGERSKSGRVVASSKRSMSSTIRRPAEKHTASGRSLEDIAKLLTADSSGTPAAVRNPFFLRMSTEDTGRLGKELPDTNMAGTLVLAGSLTGRRPMSRRATMNLLTPVLPVAVPTHVAVPRLMRERSVESGLASRRQRSVSTLAGSSELPAVTPRSSRDQCLHELTELARGLNAAFPKGNLTALFEARRSRLQMRLTQAKEDKYSMVMPSSRVHGDEPATPLAPVARVVAASASQRQLQLVSDPESGTELIESGSLEQCVHQLLLWLGNNSSGSEAQHKSALMQTQALLAFLPRLGVEPAVLIDDLRGIYTRNLSAIKGEALLLVNGVPQVSGGGGAIDLSNLLTHPSGACSFWVVCRPLWCASIRATARSGLN